MLNEQQRDASHQQSLQQAVLIGFESAGKSALFRSLSGKHTGTEANVRGSTVVTRQTVLRDEPLRLIDTPSIRIQDDSETTSLALHTLAAGDTVVLVVRSTHANTELPLLLNMLDLDGKHVVLLLTFADKTGQMVQEHADHVRRVLGISVLTADCRKLDSERRALLIRAIRQARPMKRKPVLADLPLPIGQQPQHTLLEHRIIGKWLAAAALLLLFALPVYIAYVLSGWLQPLADTWVLDPLRSSSVHSQAWLNTLLLGDYGLLSLGLYSFIWAFPVVLCMSISVALTEESGLKDRITDALDSWMRRIGLNGRDLIPVLSGFGCNVVAVFQSRACSRCTRRSCVSLITFGSACSYQIGASLSIFSSGGRPWLFLPYLITLVFVGALHTRIWNRSNVQNAAPVYQGQTFLQIPSWRAVQWRVRGVIKQFLMQAMPIFLLICVIASGLQWSGLLTWLTAVCAPLLSWFHLPGGAAEGILFSILRKDGLLVLNQGNGQLIASLGAAQLFLLVYLASTLTACLVTLWTVARELGVAFAMQLASKQMLTSVISALLLGWLMIGL
ncbi:nucleoside recognition domain-containing protein [Paenibacillus sp. WLX2291]|uniref:nucleoside recognition domain-containing protein n=1 Tax=Paenibacillus sp. WLX2291 TaxID=3296934 RepID=UPI003983F92D